MRTLSDNIQIAVGGELIATRIVHHQLLSALTCHYQDILLITVFTLFLLSLYVIGRYHSRHFLSASTICTICTHWPQYLPTGLFRGVGHLLEWVKGGSTLFTSHFSNFFSILSGAFLMFRSL